MANARDVWTNFGHIFWTLEKHVPDVDHVTWWKRWRIERIGYCIQCSNCLFLAIRAPAVHGVSSNYLSVHKIDSRRLLFSLTEYLEGGAARYAKTNGRLRSWAFGLKRKRSLACFQGSKKIPDRDRKRSLGFFRDRKRYQGFYLACFSMFLSGIFLWEQGFFLRDFSPGIFFRDFSLGIFFRDFSTRFLTFSLFFVHFTKATTFRFVQKLPKIACFYRGCYGRNTAYVATVVARSNISVRALVLENLVTVLDSTGCEISRILPETDFRKRSAHFAETCRKSRFLNKLDHHLLGFGANLPPYFRRGGGRGCAAGRGRLQIVLKYYLTVWWWWLHQNC